MTTTSAPGSERSRTLMGFNLLRHTIVLVGLTLITAGVWHKELETTWHLAMLGITFIRAIIVLAFAVAALLFFMDVLGGRDMLFYNQQESYPSMAGGMISAAVWIALILGSVATVGMIWVSYWIIVWH